MKVKKGRRALVQQGEGECEERENFNFFLFLSSFLSQIYENQTVDFHRG